MSLFSMLSSDEGAMVAIANGASLASPLDVNHCLLATRHLPSAESVLILASRFSYAETSSTADVSLVVIAEGGASNFRDPSSFMTCLSEVGGEGVRSLTTAQSNMSWIRLAMRQLRCCSQYARRILTQGDPADKDLLPSVIDEIKELTKTSILKVQEIIDIINGVIRQSTELHRAGHATRRATAEAQSGFDLKMRLNQIDQKVLAAELEEYEAVEEELKKRQNKLAGKEEEEGLDDEKEKGVWDHDDDNDDDGGVEERRKEWQTLESRLEKAKEKKMERNSKLQEAVKAALQLKDEDARNTEVKNIIANGQVGLADMMKHCRRLLLFFENINSRMKIAIVPAATHITAVAEMVVQIPSGIRGQAGPATMDRFVQCAMDIEGDFGPSAVVYYLADYFEFIFVTHLVPLMGQLGMEEPMECV